MPISCHELLLGNGFRASVGDTPNMYSNRSWLPGITGLALIASSILIGCSGANHPERVGNSTFQTLRSTVRGHAQASDDLVQFRSQGAIDVQVDSIGGNVTVIGNPNITTTTVEVTREAYHGYLRGTEPREALGLIDWTAELLPGPGPIETLDIRTAYNGPEEWFIRTHIRIETPDLESVQIRTVRGSVEIVNNTGPVDVHTTLGDILVATMYPQRGDNTLIGSEGDIDYRVPAGSTGEFDVQVIEGKIKTRITEGQWRYKKSANRTDEIHASLNSGDNPIVIRTTEGDIRIAVVKNPLGYGPVRTGA